MEDALAWLAGNSEEEDLAIILTDSLSLVSKLQRGRMKKEWFQFLKRIKGQTEVIYIPGHAGIRFNERADKLAGSATAFGDLEMTASDVVDAIARNCVSNHADEPPTWSMERLMAKEVNRGDGARILLRGEARRVSTQIKMGTITQSGLRTLLDMFEGRGPVWMPEPLLF